MSEIKTKYVASVSFGKDSLAMLLLILDRNMPLDEVVFYNTGAEFDCIYEIRDRVVKEYLEPRGIKFTELKPKMNFFKAFWMKTLNMKLLKSIRVSYQFSMIKT